VVHLLFFLIANKKQPSPSVKPVINQGSKLVAFDIYVLHLFIMGLEGIFTQVFLAKLPGRVHLKGMKFIPQLSSTLCSFTTFLNTVDLDPRLPIPFSRIF
jgi:hypothetical protein